MLAIVLADMRVQLLAPVAFMAMILACAMPGRSAPALFGNWPVMFLGDISFSLYLMHSSVLGLAAVLADQWSASAWSVAARIAFIVAVYVAVLATATLSYQFVEKPGQRIGARLRRRARDSEAFTAGGENLCQLLSSRGTVKR